ncbi:MAG: HAMP domain-containing histidine kinase [Clostridia bacterium]|nr:HAMP domain-containing histidine kinase [Clostridia bacterium]
MKKFASIKTRITIWYTTLLFILVSVVLALVATLSYQLSIDNMEKSIKVQVTQIADRLRHPRESFYNVESNKEFKNVSIYSGTGEYIVGQYIYDVSELPFKHDVLRHETIDGKEYIIYDIFRPGPPGDFHGLWIRGAESVDFSNMFGRSVFTMILIVIPLILILTALGGYYITKKAFSPVNEMIRTANDIYTQNDLKQRIPISRDARKDELYSLSVTLNRMLDKIETLIKQEKQFTSDASHELRTPISVILAQGEYLLDIADTDKEKELAKDIVDKANQVSTLVSRLLLLARIDQSRQKLNKEKVDLSVLVDIAIEGMTDFARQKNTRIAANVAENTIVLADEPLLKSAISNLISNGIKYGKDPGTITITATQTDDATYITVADDGIGIQKEHLDKIWGRFYRVDDVRNDAYGSSGLGLSMVKSIITLHGGDITVESEPDCGTTFTITLKK